MTTFSPARFSAFDETAIGTPHPKLILRKLKSAPRWTIPQLKYKTKKTMHKKNAISTISGQHLYNWTPVLGTNHLEFSIGRGFGALEGLRSPVLQKTLWQKIGKPGHLYRSGRQDKCHVCSMCIAFHARVVVTINYCFYSSKTTGKLTHDLCSCCFFFFLQLIDQ